jgi:hypothetical protein
MIATSPWPSEARCDLFYGDPHGAPGLPSAQWMAQNLIMVEPPFKMFYCGRPISKIQVHKKVAPSLTRVLKLIWIAAGAEQRTVDDWGASVFSGSFCFRPMRGASKLSIHSYGAAIDLDAPRNGLFDRTPHFTANHPVVRAFLSEGWIWGGDWNGNGLSEDERRCDGMHFQAARIK